MKRVFVTGGTGFIGRALVQALVRRGDAVTVASRDPEKVEATLGVPVTAVAWNSRSTAVWGRSIANQDAVVHLAGEPAVGQRWSASVKESIMSSRVDSTELIVEAIKEASERPSVLVCASGVGYYGPRPPDEVLDEHAESGSDYLAEVTKRWEAAALGATELGVRVVRARFGVVFGKGGGALSEMVKPFKVYMGGPIASGKQVVSWIHLDDAARVLMRAIDDASLQGPVNVVSPNPVTNEELAHAIGKVLSRPSSIRVPEVALRLRFGEGADPLVTGQRAVPRALSDARFEWRFEKIEDALEEALKG